MAALTKKNTTLLFLLHIGVYAALVVAVVSKNCDCKEGLCCSLWYKCGTGANYCSGGCRSGPCNHHSATNNTVFDIVIDEVFNGIIRQANSSCAGKSFYSRAKFLEAVESYRRFGICESIGDSKLEITTFEHLLLAAFQFMFFARS